MLTSRPTETMAAPRRRLFVTGRVGPYELVREIARAPGVTLAEGRDAEDTLWLLQLIRCRGVLGDEERVERHRHEKLLAQKTAEMVSANELVVSAHGGADIEHGERVLFWAFPYTDVPFVLERIDERALSAAELARLGAQLAERLAARHAWGRTDPLLSEHMVRIGAGGKPEVFGVPLTVPTEWLAPSTNPPRLAPEEKKTEDRRPGGDVWRLGKMLLALAERTPEAGPEMRACFESLADEDPLKRVASAQRAAELLERLTGSHRTATPVAPSLSGRRNVFEDLLATKHTDWTDSTAPEAVRPAAEKTPELVHLPDPNAASSWEIPTLTPKAPAATPAPEAAVSPADSDTVRAQAYLLEHGIETHIASEEITRKAEPQTPVPEGRPVLIDRTDERVIEAKVKTPVAFDPAEKTHEAVLDEKTVPIETKEAKELAETDRVLERAKAELERARAAQAALESAPKSGEVGVTSGVIVTPVGLIDETIRLQAPPSPITLSPKASVSADTVEAPVPVIPSAVPDTVVEPALVPEVVSPTLRVIEANIPQRTERTEPATPTFALPQISAELSAEATLPEGSKILGDEKKSNGHHVDPLAAAWQQPVLPAGESPWSEVVQPRGTHHHDRERFPGFDQDLPVPARVEGRRVTFETPAAPAPEYTPVPAYKEVPTSEIEVELAAALKSFDKKKIISGVLVALVIFGLFALLSRSGRSPNEHEGVLIATPANVVSLDSDPQGATVVSEADGSILGKTPLEVVVAPQTTPPVFLVAQGREPLRLALPDRGGITAKLVKIAEAECVVNVIAPEDIELEGVDVDIGANAERRISGAVVVRAKPGQRLRGARVVACPALGGSKEAKLELARKPAPVVVRVSAPEGASAYLNGDPIGTVPSVGRTSAAFSRVRIDDQSGASEELIVATPSEIEVRMPQARAKPVPHVTPGDEDPETAEEPSPAAAPVEEEPKAAVAEEAVRPDAGNSPAVQKPKLTRAQKIIRAKQLLKNGTKHLQAGRIQKAKDSLVECVELDPTAAECHKSLGMLYRRARATYKAREHFTRYLELVPNAADADRVRKMLEQ